MQGWADVVVGWMLDGWDGTKFKFLVTFGIKSGKNKF